MSQRIEDLLRASHMARQDIQHWADGIRIMQWRKMNRRYPVTSMTQSPNGHTHTQLIQKVGPLEAPLLESPVIVKCSCADFKYRWDYALWRDEASRGAASKRIPSDKTNPTYNVGLCKHLYKVLAAAYQVAQQGQL